MDLHLRVGARAADGIVFRAVQLLFRQTQQARDRKGQNEVDVIAVNDFEKTCDIYEVKRQANIINLSKLAEKVDILKTALKSELSDIQ